jgi:hypothetical protein
MEEREDIELEVSHDARRSDDMEWQEEAKGDIPLPRLVLREGLLLAAGALDGTLLFLLSAMIQKTKEK